MQFDEEKLNEALLTLNNYLFEGVQIKQAFLKKHDIDGQKEAFDVDSLKKEYEDAINAWYRIVAQYIFDNFEKYLYFHFTQLKTDAMSIGHPLGNLTHALDKHLFALEEVIIRLEERRNLAIRQEIAEKEHQTDVLYKITYNEHTREVKLNNIILTKTDFNSENDNCFNYIYANPYRPIGIEELETASGDKLKKRLAHIVRDLGFVNELKNVFFPVVTKDKIMFINPIIKQYAHEKDLPAINFKKLGDKVRQSKEK